MQLHQKTPARVIVIDKSADLHVPHMHFGHRIQIDIAENARKPVEILIFEPAGGRPLEDLHGKLVAAFRKIRRQLKFRRGKTVLAVPDIRSVEPEREARLHPLKRNIDRPPLHGFRHCEIPDIAADRIIP